jgi:hypothetical protein
MKITIVYVTSLFGTTLRLAPTNQLHDAAIKLLKIREISILIRRDSLESCEFVKGNVSYTFRQFLL